MSKEDARQHVPTSVQERPRSSSKAELSSYVVEHIDEALEKGWVRPYFQPVMRTLTGKLCGVEALARWVDPHYGLLMPDAFITPLEKAQLIHKLDCYIIEQVCRRYREGVAAGDTLVPFSVNLSRLDFDFCDIFRVIEDAVHKYEVPRFMVNIEITESSLALDPAYMASMVKQFHNAGYQVWMDDFGSGYSTLNVLKDFEFDALKIDMEFLSHFGEKSKTILASVVDMAKKLGIQTLAEGVETEEHKRYLRSIGCEKMQGFLFGKPRAHTPDLGSEYFDSCGIETASERLYVSRIGAVNTLSLSERDLMMGNSTADYVTSMPVAIVEFENDQFKIIDSNAVFREGLENVGIHSIEEAERRTNDARRTFSRQVHRVMGSIEKTKFARIDYVAGDVACVMRMRHIVSQGGKIALIVSIDDTIELNKRKRRDRIDDVLNVLYSIYEHVDIVHLHEGYSEQVFDSAGVSFDQNDSSIETLARRFAETEVFPADRDRYLAFLDSSTILERIREGGENFLAEFFRMRQGRGEYAWKMVGLIRVDDGESGQVLMCVRNVHWSHDGLLQAVYEDRGDENARVSAVADLAMTDASLWNALVADSNLGMFWKDRDRRFVGVNQAFLDYYGFDSVEDVAGKTDEDMKWHIDPRPFMEAEQSILSEGEHVDAALGQCIAKGESRDIIATKRPVYRDGRIVGLVGYFMDVARVAPAHSELENLPIRDQVTGLLNYIGLEAAIWKYVDVYKRQGVDFAMVGINIESLQRLINEFGYAFSDKVLKRIADELTDIAGRSCVIGHVYAERFVILAQDAPDDTLRALCAEIEDRLAGISRIDETPCTIYAFAAYARYSQFGDVEAMKRHNLEAWASRRGKWGQGGAGGSVNSPDSI